MSSSRVFVETVDRADVRMVERSEDLRFTAEAGKALRVVREGVRKDLQRDIPTELGVLRAIDLTHAAAAKQRHDFVSAEANAGAKRHLGCGVAGLYGQVASPACESGYKSTRRPGRPPAKSRASFQTQVDPLNPRLGGAPQGLAQRCGIVGRGCRMGFQSRPRRTAA
jgi:hypothetical protein